MDGIRLITFAECVANMVKHPDDAPAVLADWIDNSRHAGARTRSEIRKIGDGVIRRLCQPDEPLADCPALIFTDEAKWCAGCHGVGRLNKALNQFPRKARP